ncbi:hypothetical protein VULLAG_LOCUS17526 [Vulpes lagopus]
MAEARGGGPASRLPKPWTWMPWKPRAVKGTRWDPPHWKPGEQSGGRPLRGGGVRAEERCHRARRNASPLASVSLVAVSFSSLSSVHFCLNFTPGWHSGVFRPAILAPLLSSKA